MSEILARINIFEGTIVEKWWQLVFVELADRRTNNWPLIRNPIPALAIIFLWLGFVTIWGPKLMANRAPFKMTKLLVVYNAVQVVISVIITWQALYHGYIKGVYSLTCEPVDPTRSPSAMRVSLNETVSDYLNDNFRYLGSSFVLLVLSSEALRVARHCFLRLT